MSQLPTQPQETAIALVIRDLEVREAGDVREVSFRSSAPAGPERVWYRLPADLPPPPPDAVAACALAAGLPLPLAMRRGEPLEVRGPVCAALREGAERFQDVFRVFDRRLQRVPVAVERWIDPPAPRAPDAGALFSGGLDSFYTALTHPEARLLLLVRGSDIALDDDALWSETCVRLSAAADALGRRLVPIETNVQELGAPHMPWAFYHGAALCGVGHLLSGAIGRLFIAASYTFRHLTAWGSHPLLDREWSTSRLDVVHHGCDATRVAKAAVVAGSDAAMAALRVCLVNRGGHYNCGECRKCLRTLVNFRIAGALDRCRTFARPLDLTRVRRGAGGAVEGAFLEENLDAARARGDDPHLVHALTIALEGDGFRLRRRARRLEKKLRRIGKRLGIR